MLRTLAFKLLLVALLAVPSTFSLVLAADEEERPLKPVPKAYADKHMPAGWWTDPKIIAEGKKIFDTAQNEVMDKGEKVQITKGCSTCHEIDPEKDRPKRRGARDFRVAKKMNTFSDSYWFWRVSEGVPKTPMPSWKGRLSEEERWKAIAYEHTWSHGNKGEEHKHSEIQTSVAPE